jgi:hypothetical protein
MFSKWNPWNGLAWATPASTRLNAVPTITFVVFISNLLFSAYYEESLFSLAQVHHRGSSPLARVKCSLTLLPTSKYAENRNVQTAWCVYWGIIAAFFG